MLVAERDWGTCQIFWTRLTILCAGLHVPSTPPETMILSLLSKIILRERKITRGMFFMWLRAMCLPLPSKPSAGVTSLVASRTTSGMASATRTTSWNALQSQASASQASQSQQTGIQFISHNRNGYRLFVVLRLLFGISTKAVYDWLDLPCSKAMPDLRKFPRDQEPLTT